MVDPSQGSVGSEILARKFRKFWHALSTRPYFSQIEMMRAGRWAISLDEPATLELPDQRRFGSPFVQGSFPSPSSASRYIQSLPVGCNQGKWSDKSLARCCTLAGPSGVPRNLEFYYFFHLRYLVALESAKMMARMMARTISVRRLIQMPIILRSIPPARLWCAWRCRFPACRHRSAQRPAPTMKTAFLDKPLFMT